MKYDSLWINATIITCAENQDDLMKEAALGVKDGKIAWLGPMHALTEDAYQIADKVYDVAGHCLTPGLIDCHTHAVYAGNRAQEFALRLQGASYETIALQGGGILSTVTATRAASESQLLAESLPRVKNLLASGVTTIEIKSGYGLDLITEIKMLRVAKMIEEMLPITVIKTFLGAHTIPIEYRGRENFYVELVCKEMIPVIANEKLADAVDVFCENIAFSVAQTERIFQAAKDNGLRVKCHAEQLSSSGIAALAASYQALSVDHLEHLSERDVKRLADTGTVAVLLPGAFYFLREKKLPPIDALRDYHIPIAIASDCNPGTSPIVSMPLILNMACVLFQLTPDEAFTGATKQAAKALGLEKTHGTLSIGKVADMAIWKSSSPAELVYYAGANFLTQLIKAGQPILFD